MKRAIKQLYQKKVSELTVEEFISTIQYAVSGNTKESLPVIPKEIACVDENFYRMMQEHPEKYIIGMKALSMLLGAVYEKRMISGKLESLTLPLLPADRN